MATACPWTARDLDAYLARESLAEFVKLAWPIIEPSTPLIWNWHLDVLCDHVQALLESRLAKQNLVINVPPGSMKSTIVSVCAPAWVWIQDPKRKPGLGPGWRGLFLSGSESIALRDSMKCRDIMESPWYKGTFRPAWGFSKDQNAKGFYKNTEQGFRKCQPAGSKITGERAHAIFVDDPNDASQDSKTDRASINYWWDNGAANRVADPATGKRCLIQQRLNEEDLTGHILGKEREDWDVLVIRQEWEQPKPEDPDAGPTGLGWTDPRQGGAEGALFFPARFPAETVAQEKRRLGSAGYAGQHQQRPAPAAGLIFKKGCVQTFHPEHPPKFSRTVLSFDTAFKESEENDYSVATAWGEAETGFYLLDRWKERASYPELKLRAKALAAAWKPTALLIEDKASGQSLIQELKRDTKLPVVPIKVDRDKVSRAHAVVPLWEAGKVFVPEGAPWVHDFLDQLYGFPKLSHDDDVDSFTQALNYLHQGGGGMGLWEWMRRKAAEAEGKE